MRIRLLAILALLVLLVLAASPVSASCDTRFSFADPTGAAEREAPWRWPLDSVRVTRAFAAPFHVYGSGHRGIDLAAYEGAPVVAPASGTVAFAGTVVDRGVVTIDHGNGYVSTLEPVTAVLSPGTAVMSGDVVGTLAHGGHTLAGQLHFGVRRDGEYINPLDLLGGIPRAVLLPCC